MIFSKLSNTKLFSSLSSSSSPSHHNPPEAPTLQTLLKSGFTLTLKDFNQFLLFLSQTHKFKSLIHFFSQMKSNNIKGNAHSHSIFTWALLKEHKYEEAEQLMKTQMVDSSLLKKNRIWDCLIQGFCVNRKDPEKALLVLRDCLRIDEGPSLESAKDFNELKAISSLGHLNSQKLDPSRLGIHSGPLNDQLLAPSMGIGVKFSWWCLKLKATHHSLLFD